MPMPGTPGTLSTLSPASACTSTTLSGVTPNFSSTSGSPISLFFMVSSMETRAPTSCIKSLSEDTITTSPPASAAWQRIGRDDVVGLEALLLDAGHVEGAHRVADQRELRHKLRRRLGPVRLVIGGDGVAEAHPAVVEDHGKMRRPLFALRLAQKLPQHVAKAVHRADRQPVGGPRQRRQRVEGAENIARAVDEIDAAAGRDGGCAFRLRGLGPVESEIRHAPTIGIRGSGAMHASPGAPGFQRLSSRGSAPVKQP